jgi:hypothetical protein
VDVYSLIYHPVIVSSSNVSLCGGVSRLIAINSDEHDAEHGVRSGPRSSKPETSLRVKGCVIVPTGSREKIAR